MQRLLRALLLVMAFIVVGDLATAQVAKPIRIVSGRLAQGVHRVFIKDTLYQISGNYVVAGQLMIEPGTTVEFLPNGRLIDSVGGKIIADGELQAIWDRNTTDVNSYADRYCDLNYMRAHVTVGGKPEITAPGPNWTFYVPYIEFYYANQRDNCATDNNKKNVPYARDVVRNPIVFRGRPVNQFSTEWGHIVVLPGADTAIFRNCQFVNFRKDTQVVQSTQYYQPNALAGYSGTQILAGFDMNRKMQILSSGGGGAMTVFSSKTWILDCRFDSNFARYHGGAVQFLQAPFDATGQFYQPAPGVPVASTAYPAVDPESYDLYGGAVVTPFGNFPAFTVTPPLGPNSQYRQAYDDGRIAVNKGRVRRLYFRDNRVVVGAVINDVQSYRDNEKVVAPIYPVTATSTNTVAKNEAYGGAVYVSGRRFVQVFFGGGSALRNLGLGTDPTDTIVCERNYAVNYQDTNAVTFNINNVPTTIRTSGAKGGAFFIGDSSSMVFELSRFNDNFTAVPNIPDRDYIGASKYSQGGGIYMSTTSPELTINDNVAMRNNKSGQGGAIYVAAVALPTSDPFLSPNLLGDSVYFTGNKAEYDGGAIFTQRNTRIQAKYLTRVHTDAPGSPLIDHRILFDNNAAGLSGGAITIDNRTNTTNSLARVERVLFSNNVVGDSARVDAIRQIKLFNPVASPIRPGNEHGVYTVLDEYHMPILLLSTEVLGGGALFSYNGNTNFFRSVEFFRNATEGGNGGAVSLVTPVRVNRYFVSEGDVAYDFVTGVPVAFDDGPEPTDQRQMTRFIQNVAVRDLINPQTFNPNPASSRGTLLDPNRNYTGLGGALYINDRQPPGPNPGTPRVDSVICHRVRIEQDSAWSGSAVYSANYELRVLFNKSLIARNVATSTVGRTVDSIDNYRTSPAADSTAGALFFADVEGPLPTTSYHVNANSIYDNEGRFLVRAPDAPAGSVGFGQSGADTLRGNYWGRTEAPVTTILPSGTVQSTFYVDGYGCTLPLKNAANVNEQGPFESMRRPGDGNNYYVYTSVPIYTIPDTLLMEGRVYDIFDKGVDIKSVDYSNRRMAPIEDFSVGIPKRLRVYSSGVYQGKVVRRLTRDPFDAEIDSNINKLQREFVGNHPIGYPLFLEANANYIGNMDTVNDDHYALNNTVFFVINVETGEVIRSVMKQVREDNGNELYRSRVEFVADSINRDPLARRTREERAQFSIGELYRLTPRFYMENPGELSLWTGPLVTHLDSLQAARYLAAQFEDSVALAGRRYGGNVTAANLELGGNGFTYVNRPNGVQFADVYAGERYRALPVKTGDRIWVISRTLLWNTDNSLVQVLDESRFRGLQFIIDTLGNSVQAPILFGQYDSLQARTPAELRNDRFLVEDKEYKSDPTGQDTSRIFEATAYDPNGFYDPRSLFFPDRYTGLNFEWTPLREFSNGTTAETSDPRQVRLGSWLKSEYVYPNQPGIRDSAWGFLRFWGTPHNPDVVPGGEVLQIRVSNYPPSQRTIDSLKALADSLRPGADVIARYIYLYPPYFNCQVYDPVNARYLQQDTVDVGGASTTTYRLRIFVQDTPPVFQGDSIFCGRPGLPVANLTNKLRFDYDVNTDDESEDANADKEGWDFRYGRTTYGFVFTDRSYIDNNSVIGVDDIRDIRPVWLADRFLRDTSKTLDQGAALMRTGRLSVRIDSLEAINLLRNPAQANNVFNLDSIFTIVANDGHTGQNRRDLRVQVNVAPQLLPVPPALATLPGAKEDFDYNPQLLDSTRRIVAVDLNYNQRLRYTLVYRDDALNVGKYQNGQQVLDSNNVTRVNNADTAFVRRDACYDEAGLYYARKTTPSWLKVNPFSGLLYGTPGLNDAPHTSALGGPDTVTVVVEDEFGLTDVRQYILETDSTNHRPRLFGRPPIQCVEANKPYTDTVNVTDVDLARLKYSETLTLSVLEPAGFTVTPATINGPGKDSVKLAVNGTVPNQQGKLKIKIRVVDAVGNADTLIYEISVSDLMVFSMPIRVRNTVVDPNNGNTSNAYQDLWFGIGQRATTGEEPSALGRLDSNYCEYELPPKPPTDVFDARWTIITTNGTLRDIFPDNPATSDSGKIAWKGTFQAGNLNNTSPYYPVVFKWSSADAYKSPHDIYFEDQFFNDNAKTGLFRVNMKTGAYQAGTGITVQKNGDTIAVTINLTTLDGFKIVYDLTSGVETDPGVAGSYNLSSNVPNPFTNSTQINFFAPQHGAVKLEVFDVKGALVNTLVDGVVEAGAHTAIWNGDDQKGRAVASGTYTYRLSAGSTVLSKTMVLVK
ncbi:MAG: T9SS type A sorting domain-containing protein [Bacteroidetes bacterium]|nr:T9SS type A sorting domain-containing protein [Bacteroidota bacterium]